MFFILSKILAFLLKPLTLILLGAAYAFWTKNTRRRKRAAIAALAALIFFSNPIIINLLAASWESGQKNPDTLEGSYDIGIVLGGYTEFSAETPEGALNFHRAGNRLFAALDLYRRGKVQKLLLSGGDGKLLGPKNAEAEIIGQYLQKQGIPAEDLLIEPNSRNTRENALFSKALLDSLPGGQKRCLLITSAWHMRRAELCFQRAGLPCDTFSTDYFTEKNNPNPLKWIEPDWKALMKWEYLLKEWVGYVVYSQT
jgi:uncharacterized SAM-binding protein YcdF (DUF218 family)